MSGEHEISSNRESLIENFAAELASAGYSSVLRHGMKGLWLDLQLDLWRVLAETVKKWVGECPPAGPSAEIEGCHETFLADLTEGALGVVVQHGIQGTPLAVERGLYRTFGLVISGAGRKSSVGYA